MGITSKSPPTTWRSEKVLETSNLSETDRRSFSWHKSGAPKVQASWSPVNAASWRWFR
jgi:hypothetical protein